ncbi:ATP-dependent nuclease [Aggregatibacter aphrophilus]|uniref:ATP-dependent endonuclease n=2 Tax=Aggregatibacter aphrophilus TaxID=732 RepID=A0ABX9VSX3_AGGAP|nr:AAA family ATPase [Aggregatibacter aphrophilus]RMW80975.1 ATP-dependent endonuclease [Aggregatibacter aphrophilus]
MNITSARIKNFRLLSDVKLALENKTTVIVGRNNSGKTSLTEVIRRFLGNDSPSFQLEDFSTECYEKFLKLFEKKLADDKRMEESLDNSSEIEFRNSLPAIELCLTIEYDKNLPDFGTLSPFIIDLNENCTQTHIIIKYELEYGKINEFLNEIDLENKILFSQELKKRISKFFTTKVWAQDPNDINNKKELTLRDVKKLVQVNFINAQRGLDDVTTKESKPLARLLEEFFDTTSMSKEAQDKSITQELENAVASIQTSINKEISEKLKDLFPSLQKFGYPGLGTRSLQTEVILDVKKLLSNFTHVYYPNSGVNLPESYNGLGTRNLILILLQLAKFHKEYSTKNDGMNIHLIFIEEPEAHLHPQMQEVFIKQLEEATEMLASTGTPWIPQFVISTHSSHISNAVGFEHIRYFLQNNQQKTIIKDLKKDFSDCDKNKKFIHKYMTLTKSDLFFADKAILVEGLTERLMIPKMIEKLDKEEQTNLEGNYLTLLEISGAFAHNFLPLLKFLELKTLIVTDLDSVTEKSKGKACEVYKGKSTSNACIKFWFGDEKDLSIIKQKTDSDKVKNKIRIAYQCPESKETACGRSFEDAFMIANKEIFCLQTTNGNELEDAAYEEAKKYANKKSDFAIKYAIDEPDNWKTPKYIKDGLVWLATRE